MGFSRVPVAWILVCGVPVLTITGLLLININVRSVNVVIEPEYVIVPDEVIGTTRLFVSLEVTKYLTMYVPTAGMFMV